MNHENLISRFADAGLELKISNQPLIRSVGPGGENIVQIDIDRRVNGSRRHEWFRIYPGAEGNQIEVCGIDASIGQLVLMVKEPASEFDETVNSWTVNRIKTEHPEDWVAELARQAGVSAGRVKIGAMGTVTIRRRTPEGKRHFLLGLDERQLFIAQLPRAVTTVRAAHDSLKRTELTTVEGTRKSVRQGEWFFVEATSNEVAAIEAGLKKTQWKIEKKVPIGAFSDGMPRTSKPRQPGGNPHTVDELVVVTAKPGPGLNFPVRGREIFIRGKVRHVDHKTVSFKNWVKVIRNNEPNFGRALGVGWVD